MPLATACLLFSSSEYYLGTSLVILSLWLLCLPREEMCRDLCVPKAAAVPTFGLYSQVPGASLSVKEHDRNPYF